MKVIDLIEKLGLLDPDAEIVAADKPYFDKDHPNRIFCYTAKDIIEINPEEWGLYHKHKMYSDRYAKIYRDEIAAKESHYKSWRPESEYEYVGEARKFVVLYLGHEKVKENK